MLLSSLLLLACSTLAVAAAVPGEKTELVQLDERVLNHTTGQLRHKTKQETMALVPDNPLLLPLGNETDPIQVEALRIALSNMVRAQKQLLYLLPRSCNNFHGSVATWQDMVDKIEFKSSPLLKSDYIQALDALRKAADDAGACRRIITSQTALVRARFSQLVQHHIYVVGRLSTTLAFDNAPTYLLNRPWEIMVALISQA